MIEVEVSAVADEVMIVEAGSVVDGVVGALEVRVVGKTVGVAALVLGKPSNFAFLVFYKT